MELNYNGIMALADVSGSSEAAVTLYALVDHGAIPGLTKQLNRMGIRWTSLFEGSRDEGALEVAPILVSVFKYGNELMPKTALNWLIDKGRYTSSLQFLTSPFDTTELSRRLVARLDAALPDNIDIMLRYFDGRVFESLMAVLSDQQKSHFLCVSAGWAIVDRAGELRLYEADFSHDESRYEPLAFSVEQERALIERSEPDQVAMLLKSVRLKNLTRWHQDCVSNS